MGKRERVEDYFRKQLRRERDRRGFSQSDLAKTLTGRGVAMHATTVAKIEAGERGVRIDEAVGIADVLDVPLEWMLGRQSTGPASEIRYSLRALQDRAQETITGLGAMIQALEDWEVDTFGIAFDGKDELDADLQALAKVLAGVQARLVEDVTLRDLPEDHPVWKADLDQLREAVSHIQKSFAPLAPLEAVNPNSLTEVETEDADNEA